MNKRFTFTPYIFTSPAIKILIILLFASALLQAQWKPVNTFQYGTSLNSVYFTDDAHGWIAGSSGTILKFNNADYKWFRVPAVTGQHLNAIAFFDTVTGIAAGKNGTLLLSNDGGASWNASANPYKVNFNAVFILNKSIAFVAGDSGVVLKTTNKGTSWTTVNINTTSSLTSIVFINGKKGFIGADSLFLFTTTDAGESWSKQQMAYYEYYNRKINKISFPDSLNGFIGGGAPSQREHNSYKTTDGGITWRPWFNTPGTIRCMSFKDKDHGVIVGGDNTWNRFLTVLNDSQNSLQIYHSEDYDIMSCAVTPSGKGWAVGWNGAIFYADDYLDRWAQIYIGMHTVMSLDVSPDKHFYTSVLRGNFRETSDNVQKSFHENNLWMDVTKYYENTGYENSVQICVIDSVYGFQVKNYSSLFRTTNGGYTWDWHSAAGSNDVTKLIMRSRAEGWAYGGNVILQTTDSAKTFDTLYLADFIIADMVMANASTGYACGSDVSLKGKIIKTTDGGLTWVNINLPDIPHLSSVAFTSADTGAAVGWINTIIVTYNGGLTWNSISPAKKVNAGNEAAAENYSANKNDTPLDLWRTNLSTDVKLSPKRFAVKNDSRYKYTKSNGMYMQTKVLTPGNYTDAEFSGNVVFVSSDASEVLVSKDKGVTWQSYFLGQPVLQVKYDGEKYAAARTETNLYTFKINNTPIISAISEGSVLLPEQFVLNQNYPNPFNPSTRITYALPGESKVLLEVFNITGERTALLVNDIQPAGLYEVVYNTNSKPISSGMYIYRITAAENSTGKIFTQSRKMLFIK